MDTKETYFQISPFCIYHYHDPTTNNYHGYIGYPTKSLNSKGKVTLECSPEPKKFGYWKFYAKFYAISPMFRPIPSGLILFNTIKKGGFAYNTKLFEFGYDPFDIDKNSVSFITWTKPVPGTVPLYLHRTPSGDSFPSFDPEPPVKNKEGWTTNKDSQIFVLVDKNNHFSSLDANLNDLPNFPLGDNGIPDFKFSPVGNRCIPKENGVSLSECFLLTDEDITGQEIPDTILDEIKNQKMMLKSIDKSPKKIYNNKLIKILVIIFLLCFLIATIIILLKK